MSKFQKFLTGDVIEGRTLVEHLGEGSWGDAWLTNLGTVLKITKDEREVDAALKILNNEVRTPHHAEIYGAWCEAVPEFKYSPIFFVEREYIPLEINASSPLYDKDEYERVRDELTSFGLYDIGLSNMGKRNDGTLVLFDSQSAHI